MNNILEAVRRGIVDDSCFENGFIRRGKCEVDLNGAPTHNLLIDLDKLAVQGSRSQKRCDFLFVAEDAKNGSLVVLLELKGTGLNANNIVAQLQGGAGIAENIVPRKTSVRRFFLVAVVESASKNQIAALRKPNAEVKFFAHRKTVRLIYCGEALAGALSDSRE